MYCQALPLPRYATDPRVVTSVLMSRGVRARAPLRQRHQAGIEQFEVAEVAEDLLLVTPADDAEQVPERPQPGLDLRGVDGVGGADVTQVRDGQVAARRQRRAERGDDTREARVVDEVQDPEQRQRHRLAWCQQALDLRAA